MTKSLVFKRKKETSLLLIFISNIKLLSMLPRARAFLKLLKLKILKRFTLREKRAPLAGFPSLREPPLRLIGAHFARLSG